MKECDVAKQNVLLVNKADLLTDEQVELWRRWFEENNVEAIFWFDFLTSLELADACFVVFFFEIFDVVVEELIILLLFLIRVYHPLFSSLFLVDGFPLLPVPSPQWFITRFFLHCALFVVYHFPFPLLLPTSRVALMPLSVPRGGLYGDCHK